MSQRATYLVDCDVVGVDGRRLDNFASTLSNVPPDLACKCMKVLSARASLHLMQASECQKVSYVVAVFTPPLSWNRGTA